MELLLLLAFIGLVYLWRKKSAAENISANLQRTLEQRDDTIQELEKSKSSLLQRILALSKYEGVLDADAKATEIVQSAEAQARATRSESERISAKAKEDAETERQQANQAAKAKIAQAELRLSSAGAEADRIIAVAKQRAEEIAGEAYSAMNRAKEFSDTVQAMKNVIEGYGDQYILPTYSLLDDLAEQFGHTDAGNQLKLARENTRTLVKAGRAASCDYVETNRKETAIQFVIDAFNGKVDSVLSRTKADNHGKLEQEIRDAFTLVNRLGAAFRNARINDEYFAARLNELKWACTANTLRDLEREEQRRLRDQMREEEKARREYEKAIRDAEKEQEVLRKAVEKVERQVAAANDAQRAEYESKLSELQERLRVAEEKNQRALSMAQQTRCGHVYVISNIGSFGEEVFKIGMTRRLDPEDRIRELGDASVPFEFDIHAMIFSDDAPTLEKALHRHFLRQQMNKVNPRKEFFRLSIEQIQKELEELQIKAQWTLVAAAHDYRETLRIEEQIRTNPVIEHEWTRHQLEHEPTENTEETELV